MSPAKMRIDGPVWSNGTVPEGTFLGRATGGNVAALTAAQARAVAGVDASPTTLWVPAQAFSAVYGSPAMSVIGTSILPAFAFDASTAEHVSALIDVPDSWTTLSVTLVWANLGAGSGDVLWVWDYAHAGDGDLFTGGSGGGSLNLGSGVARTAGALDTLKVSATEFSAQVPNIPAPSGADLLVLRVRRFANDAADTLANDAGLLGVILTKVS